MHVLGTSISPAVIGALSAAICVPVIIGPLRKSQVYKYVGVPQADEEVTDRYRK